MQLAKRALNQLCLRKASCSARRRLLVAAPLLLGGIRSHTKISEQRGSSPFSERHHTSSIHQLKAMSEPALRLVLFGDIMLGRIVNQSLSFDNDRWHDCWGSVLDRVRGFDSRATIIGGNLECASKHAAAE
jgi:hypothetical protein